METQSLWKCPVLLVRLDIGVKMGGCFVISYFTTEGGGQRSEVGGREKTEVRGQRSEVGGRRSEPTTEDKPFKPTNPN